MLQLVNIDKSYTTASFTQKALDDVSIAFRDNEFVAILGPSGSGKTTLLNIIGGLDKYDSGDLIIDGTSTKEYKDRDWDTYRNNRIGFVFQSYNLIPHQTVLANVELALTLSGVERAERRQRATEALERVGLGDHIHKKPNQLSGGQMQRVAVARALINDPEILLADEPTGALDSSTSDQIMELLGEIAKERLIIMVTHNPELAEQYATRTVNLRDGRVTHDTDPLYPEALEEQPEKSVSRTSMSFLTAIALSFNNLMTKKGRTIMTAVAGSIGIIGIAAILSLANGVNNYIARIEEDTLSLYPLTIESTGFDMTSIFMSLGNEFHGDEEDAEETTTESGSFISMISSIHSGSNNQEAGDESKSRIISETKIVANMISSLDNNDLASLREYFESGESDVYEYANIISYGYDIKPLIFSNDATDTQRQINPNNSLSSLVGGGMLGGSMGEFGSLITAGSLTNVFSEMLDNTEMLEAQYDLVAGKWATEYDECVLVLGPTGGVSDFVLYSMGLRDQEEFDDMVRAVINDEEIIVDEERLEFTPEELMAVTFKVVNRADTYTKDTEHKVWLSKVDDEKFMRPVIKDGITLRIVGIVQHNEESQAQALMPGFSYSPRLQEHLIEQARNKPIVKEQLAHPALNIISGRTFQDEIDNPQSADLDMASLFGFDESALTDMFNFDTSGLNMDMSGMDMSSMDFSGMDMSSMDLSQMDLGSMDLSGMDLSGMDLSGMGDLDLGSIDMGAMPPMPPLDISDVLSNLDLSDVTVNEAALQVLMQQLTNAFLASPLFDPSDIPGSLFLYLQTPEAQGIIMGGIGTVIDLEKLEADVSDAVTAAMAPIMAQYFQAMAGQISSAIQQMMAQQMSQVIVPAITSQMSSVISQQIGAVLQPAMANMMSTMMTNMMSTIMGAISSQLTSALSEAFNFDASTLTDAFDIEIDPAQMRELMMAALTFESNSFESNLRKFDYADMDKPTSINIYPKDFDAKAEIITILDDYNARMEEQGYEDRVISYTDFVGTLMKSVTSIINTISYVLIAFVAISLVVSSIMIGIITYISVLERKKEIGILRSIGASKGDIGRVFTAETLIVGLSAGLIGVAIVALATFPINYFIGERLLNISQITILPMQAAGVLVLISMLLSFIAGLIPSSAASRRDPVEALRSE
ncbi:MAG: ATP-binding cassette domain-containing protein [Coriobacteriia bacterium]|nr:ATP-binding cassette domain-containing protein [Coriobacteriia bacterium]